MKIEKIKKLFRIKEITIEYNKGIDGLYFTYNWAVQVRLFKLGKFEKWFTIKVFEYPDKVFAKELLDLLNVNMLDNE
jgi:hypothetical protein